MTAGPPFLLPVLSPYKALLNRIRVNVSAYSIQKLLHSSWAPPVSIGTDITCITFLNFLQFLLQAKAIYKSTQKIYSKKAPLLPQTTLAHLHHLPLVPLMLARYWYWWIALNRFMFFCWLDDAKGSSWKKTNGKAPKEAGLLREVIGLVQI